MSFTNSPNACISLSRAASSTPSVLIYDNDHNNDDRNKILLRAAGSMSSTRLQRTATILPRWRTGRGTSSGAHQAGGCRHGAWAQNPAWVRTSWRERQRILFQHSTNYTRDGLYIPARSVFGKTLLSRHGADGRHCLQITLWHREDRTACCTRC